MTNINAVKRRVVLSGSAGTGPYAFTFEILDDDDIQVFKDTTLLTKTADYTVTINSNGTGSVTLGVAATSSQTITIVGARDIERTTDFVTAGDLKASSLNEQLDALTIFDQQIDEKVDRSLKGNISDPTNLDYTIPTVDNRKGKYLQFNSTTGAPEAGPNSTDVTTLASVASDIATLADIEDGTDATDAIQTVAGIAGNVTSVAAKASLITSDFVSDLNTLAVTDVINDINTLATSDIVSDLNTLATSDVVSDLNTLATTDIVSDINTLATSDIVTDLNLLATSDFVSDLNTMATTANINNLNTVAGVASNVTTVANNITNVNNFADTYFVSASAPSSPTLGDLWFDTTNNIMKVYSATGFVNAGSSVNGTSERFNYIVGTSSGSYDGSTTVFPATYDAGFVDVYLNGVKLVVTSDFTATNGTSVTLGTAANTGDTVNIIGFGTFNIANTVPDTGGTFTGGVTVTTADNTPQLTLTSTDTDANSGPELLLFRHSASPADDDQTGHVQFAGKNDAAETIAYAEIDSFIRDASDGTEDGELRLNVQRNGTLREALMLGPSDVVFNEGSEDVDFRIESNGNTSMFFLDGGNNTVGIGTNAATNPLTVRGDGGTGATAALRVRDESNQGATLGVLNSGNVALNAEQGDLLLYFGGSSKYNVGSNGNLTINDGNLVIGTAGHGIDFSATANTAGITDPTTGSELFDDYEEGSWSPTLATNSGNAASFNSSTGRYTKIGRMVMIQCSMTNINTSGTTGSSQVRITGLPFTCEQMTGHGAAVFDQITLQGGRTQLTAAVTTSEHVALTQSGGGAIGDTPTDHNDINSGGSDIIFSAVYISDQ